MSKLNRLYRIGSTALSLLIASFFAGSGQVWGTEFLEIGNKTGWYFAPGVNAGFNVLLDGYQGYDDLGNAGADLYIQPPRSTFLPSKWHHNFLVRGSFDYFPLQTPKGVADIEEDIFSLNLSLIYRFQRLGRLREPYFIPFVGLGVGAYQDRVVQNHPAIGEISGTHDHFGYVASAGLFLPEFKLIIPLRLVPEIRYHTIQIPGGKATNITYQAALVLWPFNIVDEDE